MMYYDLQIEKRSIVSNFYLKIEQCNYLAVNKNFSYHILLLAKMFIFFIFLTRTTLSIFFLILD